MAEQFIIPAGDNFKSPVSKWRSTQIAAEIARVDAAIRALENPRNEPLSFAAWQPLGQVSRLVSLQSLKRYRQRLGRAR